MLKTIRGVVSIIVLILSIGMLAWALVPARRQTLVQVIAPVTVSEVDGSLKTVLVIQDYQAVLEWPDSLRIGETGKITLTFEPVPAQANSKESPSSSISVYTSNNLMAESNFEVAGLQVNPANPRLESLLEGKTVKPKWQVGAQQPGTYQGNVWLSLQILPLSGGAPSNIPIFIHEVNVHATSFLGLSGPLTRTLGGIGIAFSVILSIDVMIALVKRWVRKRDTKDHSQTHT